MFLIARFRRQTPEEPPCESHRSALNKSYRAKPGAVVNGKAISVGDYSGREIDIAAVTRAPLVIRIFDAHDKRNTA